MGRCSGCSPELARGSHKFRGDTGGPGPPSPKKQPYQPCGLSPLAAGTNTAIRPCIPTPGRGRAAGHVAQARVSVRAHAMRVSTMHTPFYLTVTGFSTCMGTQRSQTPQSHQQATGAENATRPQSAPPGRTRGPLCTAARVACTPAGRLLLPPAVRQHAPRYPSGYAFSVASRPLFRSVLGSDQGSRTTAPRLHGDTKVTGGVGAP